MDGVGTPIIGRPRPLPGHDTPNPPTTLTPSIMKSQQTLTDHIRVLGQDHPHTLASRNNLASAYKSAVVPEIATALLEGAIPTEG